MFVGRVGCPKLDFVAMSSGERGRASQNSLVRQSDDGDYRWWCCFLRARSCRWLVSRRRSLAVLVECLEMLVICWSSLSMMLSGKRSTKKKGALSRSLKGRTKEVLGVQVLVIVWQ